MITEENKMMSGLLDAAHDAAVSYLIMATETAEGEDQYQTLAENRVAVKRMRVALEVIERVQRLRKEPGVVGY